MYYDRVPSQCIKILARVRQCIKIGYKVLQYKKIGSIFGTVRLFQEIFFSGVRGKLYRRRLSMLPAKIL